MLFSGQVIFLAQLTSNFCSTRHFHLPVTLKPLLPPPAPCTRQAPSCCDSSRLAQSPTSITTCSLPLHSVCPSSLPPPLCALSPRAAASHPTVLHLSHDVPAEPPLSPRECPFTFSLPFSFSVSAAAVPPRSAVLFQHRSLAAPGRCSQHRGSAQ